MKLVVLQKGKSTLRTDIFRGIIAVCSCYICLIMFFVIDFFIWQFQNIYFRMFDIPLIMRSDYVSLDRYKLSGLNIAQKINCTYCGYGNGIIGYAKAVINQMEIYSCAIKHVRTPKGQDHHEEFHDRKNFE